MEMKIYCEVINLENVLVYRLVMEFYLWLAMLFWATLNPIS